MIRHRRLPRRAASALAALALIATLGAAAALLAPTRALAHGEDTLVYLQPHDARPGEIVWVLGHGLGEQRPIEVRLAYEGEGVPLGQVVTGSDGDFVLPILLPRDLRGGEYRVQAWLDGEVHGVTLRVDGAPRDGPVPNVGVEPVAVVVPATWRRSAGPDPLLVIGAIVVVAVGVLLLALRRRRPASITPPHREKRRARPA